MALCDKISFDYEGVYHFKQLKEIFIELADRKGTVNRKNFENNLRPIMNKIGSLSESFREELSKVEKIEGNIAKLSKYCDQILLCIMRTGPYELLDE